MLLKLLTSRPNRHAPQSAAVPSLREIIVVDNSDGRQDLSPFRSILHYNDVAEDGIHGGHIPKANLDPGDGRIF